MLLKQHDVMIIASWMIMWLQDHDHVVTDAERGGDATLEI
jgi:hypothetical protein